jgi:ferritin-like metal-binding protein YciE
MRPLQLRLCFVQPLQGRILVMMRERAPVPGLFPAGMGTAERCVTMNAKHQDNLKMYVNDVIALERDIVNAIEGQLEDDRVQANPRLVSVLSEIVGTGKSRITRLKAISDSEGGSVGAAIKEAAMSVTGALAGVYGKLREHPLSRMVRDNRVAMNVTETSYAMLYTLALATGHQPSAEVALDGLNTAASQVLKLTDLLPGVVLRELSDDAPLVTSNAEEKVLTAIHDAWTGAMA